jgi:hypothetical protein
VTLKITTHKDAPSYYFNWRETGNQATNKSAYNWANDTTGTERTYTVTGLKNGVEYEFYVYCDGVDSAYVPATPVGVPATGVTLTSHAVDTLVGGEVVLNYTIQPSESRGGVLWESSDESILTVEQNGRIRAVSLGTATITATAITGDASDTCVITVKDTVDKPVDGSLVIGDVHDVEYDETGGHAQVPFTVTVATNKPNYRFVFSFTTSTTLQYRITGISLNGTQLPASSSTEVDDLKIQIGALPYPTSGSSVWATATPKTGNYLTPGKTYEFLLDVDILGTATPITSIGYSNMSNNTGFFYYDPDYDNRMSGQRVTGTIYATWTGAGVEPPTSGTGANLVYNLSTAGDLLWYANKWNTDTDFNFGATLYADIDLTGTAFAGIGTAAHPLSKNFNGNGKTVTYALEQSTDGGAIGFIRHFEGSANNFVSNLTTAGTLVVSGNDVKVGGIIGEVSGSAYIGSGCVNNVNIQVTGTGGWVGGIAGYMNSTYSSWNPVFGSSINNGTINAPNAGYVGGIAGYVRCIAEFNETVNNGAVTGSGYVGGIVGYQEYAATGKRIGTNTNNGVITGVGGEATGGIAGKVVLSNIGGYWDRSGREDGNLNYGAVTGATKYVGGIVGYVDDVDAQFIVMNYNDASVTSTYAGEGFVGGVLGYLTGGENITIIANINKGTVTGGAASIEGGIIAKVENTLTESKCRDNYYAEQEGLPDAAFAVSAPNSFLSLNGWAPNYSGSPDDDGTAEHPYKLANAFDMIWFASQVNGGVESDNRPIRSAYVELADDIDLSDYPTFEGIGVYGIGKQTFHGTFDGKDHTIILALDASAPGAKYDNAALFQQISGATIKNLKIEGTVNSKPNVGSAAAVALGSVGCTFENITNYADVTAFNNAGGITTGDWNGPDRLINLKNYGTIIGGNAAGIVTQVGGQCVIEGCENYGDVTAFGVGAGIVGSINGGSKSNSGTPSYYISNCVNNGTITSLSSVTFDAYTNQNDQSPRHTAGGIVGAISGAIVDLNNCTNNGLVQSTGNSAGGIVGSGKGEWNIGPTETSQMTDIRVTNTTNNGDVQSIYNGDDPDYLARIAVGGIFGQTGEYDWTSGNPGGTQGLTLTGNTNNGTISGPVGSNVGAIIGITDTGTNSSGGIVIIGDNWSSTEVIGGGMDWNNPRYASPGGTHYDPATEEIINGQLVVRQPPNNNDNSTTNDTTTNTTYPAQTTTDSSTTSTSGVTTTPTTTPATTPTTTPRTNSTPNTTNDSNAETVPDTPTPLVGSEVVPTKQAQTFIEYVIDNPLLIPVGILALALIVGGAAFAYVRFKRNTAVDGTGRGRHGQ